MTITPTVLVPAAAASTTSAAAGTGKGEQAAVTGFGALLAQLAGVLPHGKAGAAGQGGAATLPGTGTVPVSAETLEGEEAATATLLAVPSSAATVGPVTALAGAASVAASSEATGASGGDASLADTAVRGVTGTAAVAVPGPGQPGLVQPQSGQAGQLPAGQTVSGTGGEATAQTPAEGPPATPATAEPVSAAVVAAGYDGGAASQAQPAQSTPTNAVAPGSVTAAASAGGAATAAPAASTPSPLLDQVTPVVSRMVSAGEGSHRMVLRLHPADLGEVQLTVTVRGDSVDVTVAAGTEARELMAGGSSELRALLDSIGRTAGNITFKELPGASQLQSTPTGLPTTGQDAGQSGTTYAGADTDRDGSGRGDAARHAATDQRTATTADLPDGTETPTRSPGSDALDVRI